jgi:general secretion pathway protein D
MSTLRITIVGAQPGPRLPHVIPNPFDNTLLIQGTPQEYGQIMGLLRQLDVPPRQVLVDAKIYEVSLSGAFSAGVTAYLEQKNTGTFSRTLNAVSSAAGVTLTTGALVLKSHELLAALTASETKSHTRVISAPSIIATDSIPATLNVGDEVPVLTSQAVGGVQRHKCGAYEVQVHVVFEGGRRHAIAGQFGAGGERVRVRLVGERTVTRTDECVIR